MANGYTMLPRLSVQDPAINHNTRYHNVQCVAANRKTMTRYITVGQQIACLRWSYTSGRLWDALMIRMDVTA